MSTSYRFYSAALSLFTYVPTSLAVAAVVTLTANYWTAFVQWTNLSDRVLFVLATLFIHEIVVRFSSVLYLIHTGLHCIPLLSSYSASPGPRTLAVDPAIKMC